MRRGFLQLLQGLGVFFVLLGAQGALANPSNVEKVTLNLRQNIRSQAVYSPKSVVFMPDGTKFYVNALEGKATLVFESATLELRKVIKHTFTEENSTLFLEDNATLFDYTYNNCQQTGAKNIFGGKPVECVLTHNGQYLWVPYYRRDCDPNASSPSAVAIIDTFDDTIIRVLPTPPLPKMVTAARTGERVAITDWGDNTVALINTATSNPFLFAYEKLLTVGERLNVRGIAADRDRICGLCLRGTTFTHDGKFLVTSGMKTNKLFVFDVESGERVGTVTLPVVNPRHLLLNDEGTKLYVSFNVPGKVAELAMEDVFAYMQSTKPCPARVLKVGSGARTLTLSKDGSRLYVVCNKPSTLSCIDIASWKILSTVPVAPYAVGLAVNADETMAVVTSQGRSGHGGNNVAVFDIVKTPAQSQQSKEE